jgi:putative OmpL-like beta-barrel porin-2
MGTIARAQDAAPAAAPAAAPSAAPAAAAPAAAAAPTPVWSVGSVDLSGYLDVYYSYNKNRPADQVNDLYNFDDATDQFNLEAAKLTLNHDPDPVGAHLDILFGRTNALIHGNSYGETVTDNYIEQAYLSVKPPKAKGFEMDLGQFTTSAGEEVIETMSNWSYSHGLLFSWAIPYYHFGVRTSLPATKTWTVGVQLVNGWNDVIANNGGITVGVTSGFVKPKYTWNVNYYVGPSNTGLPPHYAGTQMGYRNLIDSTLLLTPTAKFNAYINYDYGQNHLPYIAGVYDEYNTMKAASPHWQGIAASARGQITANSALVGRYEYFYDDQGYAMASYFSNYGDNPVKQTLQEFTGTYEYKWPVGLLLRAEYRYDWSTKAIFTYGNTYPLSKGAATSQQTATLGLIAFFGPKR